MKTLTLNLRAQPRDWSLIDDAAHTMGKSLADFMLEAAWEKARSVRNNGQVQLQQAKGDQVAFVLDREQFVKFVAQLDAQPGVNAAVRRLASSTACWEPKAAPR
jgi:hypothetical protein